MENTTIKTFQERLLARLSRKNPEITELKKKIKKLLSNIDPIKRNPIIRLVDILKERLKNESIENLEEKIYLALCGVINDIYQMGVYVHISENGGLSIQINSIDLSRAIEKGVS